MVLSFLGPFEVTNDFQSTNNGMRTWKMPSSQNAFIGQKATRDAPKRKYLAEAEQKKTQRLNTEHGF